MPSHSNREIGDPRKGVALSIQFNVERQSSDHLYWPDLDIDLTLDMIDYPHKYPLTYK